MKFALFFGLLIVSIIGCRDSRQLTTSQSTANKKDSIILFFNIKEYSRIELSRYLAQISAAKPKIIALNFLLPSFRGELGDSLLLRSIEDAGNVILPSYINNSDTALVRSDYRFVEAALGEGVVSYQISDDSVTREYVPLYQNSQGQSLSFPTLIAFNYSEKAGQSFSRLEINEPVTIRCSKTLDDFVVLNDKEMTKSLLSGKIVILDYLDQGGPKSFVSINEERTETFQSVVTANIILNILE